MFDLAPCGLTHGDGSINTCPRGDNFPPPVCLLFLDKCCVVTAALSPYELQAAPFNATFPKVSC